MKRYLFGLLVLVFALITTSCNKDEGIVNGENEVAVSFNAALPSGISTRAIADGTTAVDLKYAVYLVSSDATTSTEVNDLIFTGEGVFENLRTEVKMSLVNGKTYNIVFWAESENSPYTFDAQNIAINANYALANQEDYDAFFNCKRLTVTGPVSETITLKRPFAQLNVGAMDYEDAVEKGMAEIAQTSLTVTAYNTLNPITGAVSGKEEITYNLADLPTEKLTVNGYYYTYMSMNYILVNEKELFDCSVSYDGDVRTYYNVPLQRNYRTNIIGNLFTSESNFRIVVNAAFDDEVRYSKLRTVLAHGGTYVVEEDIFEYDPRGFIVGDGKEVVIDLAGHTITTAGNAFVAGEGSTLTIIDSVGEGKIIANTGITEEGTGSGDVDAEPELALTKAGEEYYALVADGGNILVKYGIFQVGLEPISTNFFLESNNGDIILDGGIYINHTPDEVYIRTADGFMRKPVSHDGKTASTDYVIFNGTTTDEFVQIGDIDIIGDLTSEEKMTQSALNGGVLTITRDLTVDAANLITPQPEYWSKDPNSLVFSTPYVVEGNNRVVTFVPGTTFATIPKTVFATNNTSLITVNDLTFEGKHFGIFGGVHDPNTRAYKSLFNNIHMVRNGIFNYITSGNMPIAAFVAYGETTLENCTILDTYEAVPESEIEGLGKVSMGVYDVEVVNDSHLYVKNSRIGRICVLNHAHLYVQSGAVVDLVNPKPLVKGSITIESGAVVKRVEVSQYSASYPVKLNIKAGAEVGTLCLDGKGYNPINGNQDAFPVTNLSKVVIEEGAIIEYVVYGGVTYTLDEFKGL